MCFLGQESVSSITLKVEEVSLFSVANSSERQAISVHLLSKTHLTPADVGLIIKPSLHSPSFQRLASENLCGFVPYAKTELLENLYAPESAHA